MHEPWRDDFSRFLVDIVAELGERPPNHSIDRIDNHGSYVPGNIRWATAKMQANNRRSNRTDLETAEIVKLYEQGLDGETISNKLGCGHNTVYRRLASAGITLRPQSIPLDLSQLRDLRDQGLTYQEIADRVGCSLYTARRRLLGRR